MFANEEVLLKILYVTIKNSPIKMHILMKNIGHQSI
jgi:hypothetical protein